MNIGDLLEICQNGKDKNIYLSIIDDFDNEEIKIPMGFEYYIADDMVFFEVNFKNKYKMTKKEFVKLMENEVYEDSCWGSDIYVAPMEKLGNCELKFAKNYNEVINNDIFYNCYDIKIIKEFENAIVIYLV